MGRSDFYDHGNPNMVCDRCGQKYKKSELHKTWDNLYVCNYDYELRQPQDRLRSFKDKQSFENPRPEAVSDMTYWDGSALAETTNDPSQDDFVDTNEVQAGDL